MQPISSNKLFFGIVIVLILNQVIFRVLGSAIGSDAYIPEVLLNVVRVFVYFALGIFLAYQHAAIKFVAISVLLLSFIDHVLLNSVSFLVQYVSGGAQIQDGLLYPIIGLLGSFVVVFVVAILVSLVGYRLKLIQRL